MVETGDTDDQEYVERITSNVDVKKDAWSETIDDMKAMAAELEAEGWDVFYVAAGHTAPETPEAGEYPEYDVFRQELSGTVFSVTVLRDPDSMTAILIASALTLSDAPEMINKSRSEGKTYTHVQTLDKTHLGSFEHEAPEKFFPNFEQYDAYLESEE